MLRITFLRITLIGIVAFSAVVVIASETLDNGKCDFYMIGFPEQRLEFWRKISDQMGHMEFAEALETLKVIDELSDDSNLSLFEFKTYITVKLLCQFFWDLPSLLEPTDQHKPVDYLDQLVNYTRKSKRWQNEVFVTEYFFSVFYASFGEYEKSKEALDKFTDIIDDRHSKWVRWHTFSDHMSICYHAACIYARLGECDKAVRMCKEVLAWDISSWKIDPQDKKLDEVYKRLQVEPESWHVFMDEVREKKEIFSTKK